MSAGKFGGGAGARRGPGTCREAAGRPSPARRRLPALQHAPLPLSQPAMGAWLPLCLLSAALAAAAASGESLPRAGPLPRPPPGSGRCPGEGWCSEEKPPGLPRGFRGAFPPARPGRGSACRPPPFWRPLRGRCAPSRRRRLTERGEPSGAGAVLLRLPPGSGARVLAGLSGCGRGLRCLRRGWGCGIRVRAVGI